MMRTNIKIAVAGTGYVGLSIATLLSQHHHVTAVDVIPEKVDLINHRKSPIQDEYIEKYLVEKDLDLTATLDGLGKGRYEWKVALVDTTKANRPGLDIAVDAALLQDKWLKVTEMTIK